MTGGLARRLYAYGLGWGALLALLWPLFGGGDSFPLSNYPMFSRGRGQPVLNAVVASDNRGRRYALPSTLLGSDEVLQAKVLLDRAVAAGPDQMARLCAEVAERLAARGALGAGAGVLQGEPQHVEIVASRYDPVRYFTVGPEPLARESLFRCDVQGTTGQAKQRLQEHAAP
jgi:hypothetical protein